MTDPGRDTPAKAERTPGLGPPGRPAIGRRRAAMLLLAVLLVLAMLLLVSTLAVAGCDDDEATTTTQTTAAPTTTSDGGILGEILGEGVLPDVVGLDLQLAQDTLQAGGWYLIEGIDASGQDRMQVLDRNWVVVEQDPPAGTPTDFTDTIELRAVKRGEPGSEVLHEPVGLPDVAGMNLQLAIDTMQAAGYYRFEFVDVTGRDRRPIAHSNWVVVEQSPAPGAEPPKTSAVTLRVKKKGE
jgi:hypothetical protein